MVSAKFHLKTSSPAVKSDFTPNTKSDKLSPAQRAENRAALSSANKDELITKRQNLCFGAKLQPEWESRSLNINPILSDDLHRFLGNEQHTQRWALAKHAMHICLSNVKRIPYIWGLIIMIINIVAPPLLRKGTPRMSWRGNAGVLIASFAVSFIISGFDVLKRFIVGRCVDYKRYYVLQPKKSRLKKVPACDLVVGNIIKLTCDELVPTDMIILYSSNPDGQVHVDSSLVDGDRDLKIKYTTKYAKVESSIHSFSNLRGQIVCDRPSSDLDNFNATLRLKGHPRPRTVYLQNFILKGSIIRNTATVYGVVTHTGLDTKIAQNINKDYQRVKFNTVDVMINHFTVIVAIIYLVCLFVSMGTRWSSILASERRKAGTPMVTESLIFVAIRFITLYGGMIPVTLPAVVDVLRYAYSAYYDGHVDYSFLSDGDVQDKSGQAVAEPHAVVPVTWTMNHGLLEELGMVDIIFCDKTGTLTTNDLQISLINTDNKTFDVSGDRAALQNDIDAELEHNEKLDQLLRLMCVCNVATQVTATSHMECSGLRLGTTLSFGSLKHSGSGTSDISADAPSTVQYPLRTAKSKIHFGNVSYIDSGNQSKFTYKHLGSDNSMELTDNDQEADTDEAYASSTFPSKGCRSMTTHTYKSPFKECVCMMDLSRDLGYKLLHRSKTHVQFDARGTLETFSIVGLNQYSLQRRRMSIVIRKPDSEGATIFVKGSGETMLSLLSTSGVNDGVDLVNLPGKIERLTCEGYRVLVCACRELTPDETRNYQRHYSNAEESVYSGEMLHEEATLLVESNLKFLGIIAFKDEIQDGVRETLDLLLEAGVRVWMTTGDNRNAAIETAYLTNLLTHPCRIFDCRLPYTRSEEITQNDVNMLYETFLQQRNYMSPAEQLCLVVEGSDLKDFLSSSYLQTSFVNMLCFADVVIACGLSPTEKADFVRLVKVRLTPTPITLAIGDGLNDVKMMQEAHIGVAVLGTSPDALAYADFVTTHFAGLRSLLFYQGSNTLQVMAAAIYWSFFKCICLVMPIFYYQGHTDWAGLELYGSFIQLIFHLIFTALPIIFCGLFDHTIAESILTHVPLIYTLGRRRYHINYLCLGFAVLEGIVSSIFCYMSIQTTAAESPIFAGGSTISARAFGLLCSLGSLQMSNSRILMDSFTRNNSFGLIWTLVFLVVMPPVFMALCVMLGGKALRTATFHIMAWPPFYMLIPIWITTGVVCHVLMVLTQSVICPNITRFFKHWLSSQVCKCPYHNPNTSAETVADDEELTTSFKPGRCGLRTDEHYWCDSLLRKVHSDFNLNGSEALMRMVPAARPFRVREGDLSAVQLARLNSSNVLSKDSVDDIKKNQSNVNLRSGRVSHLIDRITLRFKDMQLEADYRLHKRRNNYRSNRLWYRIIFIAIGMYYMLDWTLDYSLKKMYRHPTHIYTLFPALCVALLCVGCAILTFYTTYFVTHINKALGVLVVSMILHYIISLSWMEPMSSLQPLVFPILTYVVLHFVFIYALVSNVIFLLAAIGKLGTSIHVLPLFIAINVFVAFVGYRLEYNSRKNFLFEFSANNARKKQSELLNTMLPTFVVTKMINARLNEDGIPIGFEAEEHTLVSVVFCDVCNFQNLVATVEPTILVELLDSLFLAFDRCAEQFGATKIETVFETYLAALGLSRGNIICPYEAAANSIDMALAMIEVARSIRYTSMQERDDGTFAEQDDVAVVKVGINSGKIISGLVGFKKPQYALFGDTVNTASRMKTTGESGYIHISTSTYDLVKSDVTLHFEHRETFVKGKGIMNTHLLISAEGSSYPHFEVMERSSTLDGLGPTFTEPPSTALIPLRTDSLEVAQPNRSGSDNIVLFECVEKDHILNKLVSMTSLRRGVSAGSRSSLPLYAGDNDRAFARSLRISAAVGVLGDNEEAMASRSQNPFLRNGSSYSMHSGSATSTASSGGRCLSLRRRTNTTGTPTNAFGSNDISRTSTLLKEAVEEEDELNTRIDGGEMQMQTTEWLFLKFHDRLQEDRYRSHFYNNRTHINTIEQSLVIFLMAFIFQSLLEVAVPRSFEDREKVERLVFFNYTVYWTVRSIYLLLLFVMWLLFRFNLRDSTGDSNWNMWLTFALNLFFVSAACVFSLSGSWAVEHNHPNFHLANIWLPSDNFKFYTYIVVIHHNNGMLFQTCLLVDSLFMVISMSFINFSVAHSIVSAGARFTIPCYILFNLVSAHCKESIDRATFYSNEKARMIEARVGQMLNDMLPKSVLEEFKHDKLKMSYCHEKMSFLFSDIVGFTLWANSVDAGQVITLLQRLFARFDRSSTKHGLYKLCTIGDAYVAVSEPAIEVPTEQEAIANIDGILQMAQSMIRTIRDVRESFDIPGLNMRIGLHYGHAVGGVIGSGRLRYDLWGMDIHTANAMESHGIPGKINISERLKLILMTNFPERFTFEFHSDVQVIDRCVRSFIITSDSNDSWSY
ncbi:Adenylate and Guanylate cyclase catalytic domain family protein [Babesia bovis T2Bo]|uniref:Adenylate and guanylate cyclase catalytic domain containing protein n=1 Tax=Babesia bovis TaxID=5865 RepID=A7AX98_BABBO|nr:Adenylate and Guanylate cyclase catalytic domain family protein [Babesia bovis T2Bo]EDO05171.1 Adenylate and Guanylate cyclase catalytic domain family protein [Babesia bovis T2Bo]|eukprot:XP_001608739.1 adenylate and guanylate cyclase catalytic domain containing protein [Babesia bovis T2Bo]